MQQVTIYPTAEGYSFNYIDDSGNFIGNLQSFPEELHFALEQIRNYVDEILTPKKKVLNYFIENSSDEEKLSNKDIFAQYQVGRRYKQNDIFLYNNKLYKVVQTHTSQLDWNPEILPALYTWIALPDEILEWKQPLGAHDAYQAGDRVLYEGDVYICVKDDNVWPPTMGELFWIREDLEPNPAEPDPEDPEEPEEPIVEDPPAEEGSNGEEYPAWVPWDNNNDNLYQIGDKVSHNEKRWIATADNNHWEPGVYGWEEVVE